MSRLISLVPRLTAPLIVRGDGLPSFGKTVQWPRDGGATQYDQHASQTAQDEEAPSLFSLLATPAPVFNVNDKKVENRKRDAAESPRPSLRQLCTDATACHRVIFFGEQHHQPKVLSAQMQVLFHILQAAKECGSNVHVVLEHWSLEDRPLLSRDDASCTDSTEGENSSTRPDRLDKTSEGFNSDHYMMLVQLTRELQGSVWGGFPPREWARIVAKGAKVQKPNSADSAISPQLALPALRQVQELDQERFARSLAAFDGNTSKVIPPLPLAKQRFITNVGWGHRAYLKGMFRPDERPLVPEGFAHDTLPPEECTGFLAAQALKDTYLAHTITTLLQRDPTCTVVAICGAGHCEWSFGAPERVQQMMAESSDDDPKIGIVRPYIFLSKPEDSGYWPESDSASKATHSLAGAAVERAECDEQWQRKQADTILLYEWIDN